MRTFVALFRGINVGGAGVLPMQELAAILEDLGLREVRTYIQSGNAVFRAETADPAALGAAIRAAIGAARGFEPETLVLTLDEFIGSMRANPFPEAESDPKSLHLGFLAAVPAAPDLAGLEALRSGSERFSLIGRVFYLHAPDGVGRSRLAARAEKLLGVPLTDRNWNTVKALAELAGEA